MRSGSEERARLLDAKVAEREARANGVERELKVEREWRTSLQEASVSSTEKISQLLQEIDQLKSVHEVINLIPIYLLFFLSFLTTIYKHLYSVIFLEISDPPRRALRVTRNLHRARTHTGRTRRAIKLSEISGLRIT